MTNPAIKIGIQNTFSNFMKIENFIKENNAVLSYKSIDGDYYILNDKYFFVPAILRNTHFERKMTVRDAYKQAARYNNEFISLTNDSDGSIDCPYIVTSSSKVKKITVEQFLNELFLIATK